MVELVHWEHRHEPGEQVDQFVMICKVPRGAGCEAARLVQVRKCLVGARCVVAHSVGLAREHAVPFRLVLLPLAVIRLPRIEVTLAVAAARPTVVMGFGQKEGELLAELERRRVRLQHSSFEMCHGSQLLTQRARNTLLSSSRAQDVPE